MNRARGAASVALLLLARANAATPGLNQRLSTAAPLTQAIEQAELRVQLSPRDYTTMSAEIGAKIESIAVKEGQAFRAGQALVSLDCSLQRAQQRRARAELAGAEQVLDANRRLAELNAIGHVELNVAVTQVEKLSAELAYVKATLAKCTLLAPFNGKVAEQKARAQQFVQPGQALLDILDDSALELEFIAPSRWLAWLKTGHAFQVAIDETGKTYPARITRLGARVDPLSQSIKAAATIDGKFPDLIAGMSGHLLLAPPAARPE